MGIPHFQLGTGEELTDDHDHYLVWEPGPHWDRGGLEEAPGRTGSAQLPRDSHGQPGASVAGLHPS